ncbi:MAG: SUMF1/EgtB/PvdO family nonheme iron enzyme [Candidatus Competibacter sp.]|nr:SUMF1/EgtB/PvdO family nonheme iron enzyme [Candidatus Competibacter sp.]
MTEPPPSHLEQLRRALDAGLIDRDTYDAAVAAMTAQLAGSGAIAQGQDALAVGAGGVGVRGDNQGTINLGVLIQQGIKPGASPADLRRAYLARILTQANQLPLFVGDGANAQVRLSSVYTALLTGRSEGDATLERVRSDFRSSPERAASRLSALDVLNAERQLVLLGGPGSGKSTFVNFVALAMAGELLELPLPGPNLATLTAPLPREEGDREEPRPQRWNHGALLPVQVTLRDLASQLPPPGTPVKADAVWDFICGRLRQAALAEFAPCLQQALLGPGGLVLLDGLDEVPDALDRRAQIKQAVQDFAATFSRCRFLVTSRIYAYQRQDWKLDGFAEVHLLPFTPGQIGGFVDAWYAHMIGLYRLTEPDAEDRAEVLKRAVGRNERLRELAEHPLLLTLIAQLQTEGGGALPEKREELYDKAVEMLLDRWERMKIRVREDGAKEIEPSLAEWLNAGRDDIRKQLNRLAFEAHRDQPHLTGTADIRQSALLDALLDASANRADVKVRRLEEYLRDRAGLLAAHGVGMYQFPHRSFQEYLAACHLTDDEFPDRLAELARGDPNRWREVALLAGAKAARGSSLNAWALAETLCPAPVPDGSAPVADQWGGLLAGRVLVECADFAQVAPRNVDKRARVRDWQCTILRGNTLPATERTLAGRTLAALGDPRPEVMSLDDMHFCLVPPGPFVMGDDHYKDEKPQHTVDLAYPYFIARFPVTVAQWREYAERSGRPVGDDRSLRGRENEPVVYVSWHEARRCCEFLTQKWRGVLPQGFVVTLPSEAEWEKAARGGKQVPVESAWVTLPRLAKKLEAMPTWTPVPNPYRARAYPWGDAFDLDMANTESTVGETSVVGCYPTGFSPYGCEDLSGNVWEWTRSLWGKDFFNPAFGYPYDPDNAKRENLGAGDDVMRVLRGGSWNFPRDYARCAARYGYRPDYRRGNYGFRVVLRSAPVS